MQSITYQANHYQSRHRRQSIWRKIVTVLASVVVFCTTYALILPAITMTADPICGLTEHTHSEECWQLPEAYDRFHLICTPESLGIHVHDDTCYDAEGGLLCGMADFVLHTHDDRCCDETGTLVCPLKEVEAHLHGEDCWQQPHIHHDGCYVPQQGDLICLVEEGALHVHEDSCYTPKQTLLCEAEEVPAHVHSDSCYTQTATQTCTLEEVEGHAHDTACYDETGATLLCKLPEIAGHLHTEECFTVSSDLTCGLEETEGHTHTETCWLYETELTCTEDTETPHVHGDTCYAWTPVLNCTEPTAEDGAVPILICEQAERVEHIHRDACYITGPICSRLQMEEHMHTDICFTVEQIQPTEPVLVCGLEEHAHADACYPVPEVPAEPLPGMPEGDIRYCGLATHAHNELCVDETGMLLCTMTEHQHDFRCDLPPVDDTDVETPDIWEATLPELTGSIAQDVIAIAESQLGYRQSAVNYVLTEEAAHFYSRYSAWWNEYDAYAPWNAAFAAFCLDYAGAELPLGNDADLWLEDLTYYAHCIAEDQQPILADLAFLKDGRVGIVTEITDSGFTAILEQDGEVIRRSFSRTRAQAFARIPGNGLLEEADPAVDEVKALIEQLPPAEEMRLQWLQHTAAGDEEALQMMRTALAEQVMAVQERYDELTAEQQAKIENAAILAELANLIIEMDRPVETTPVAGEKEFLYEDDTLEVTLQVTGWMQQQLLPDLGVSPLALGIEDTEPATPWEDLALVTDVLDETSTAFRRAEAHIREQNNMQDVDLTALQFRFMNGDEPVDTTGWDIQATVAPKQELVAPTLAALEETEAAPEAETGVVLTALQVQDTQVTTLEETVMQPEDDIPVMTFALPADGVMAVSARQTANPPFKVQYYAYINTPDESGSNPLTVINTDNGGNGTGVGNLPKNGTNPATMNLYLKESGGQHIVATSYVLTEVYRAKSYNYIQAPNLTYFNSLYENGNYILSAVWILRSGSSETSIDPNDWVVYQNPDNLHFTNREASANNGTILITNDTVIRLVFDTAKSSHTNAASFYDYDITSGKYTIKGNRNSKVLETAHYGINSSANYTNSGTKLAFGNNNAGVDYGTISWNGNELNKYNTNGYHGCTFGLAQSYSNGEIVYSNGVDAPNLFDEGSATGKTVIDNLTLNFDQDGDTYVLHGVNGTRTNSLHTFKKWGANTWSNDFWPMDDVSGTDPHFGSTADYNGGYNGTYAYGLSEYGTPLSMPLSDDGTRHNAYFGMHYAVQFTLTPDYVGPLEYYFFGDDDMWVFLDGQLVCDIGGVHSSVGEYVNLWDYLSKDTDDATHTLDFFYTERGASGSSCYMRFTLPSVSSVTPSQNTGSLKVQKRVEGGISNSDTEFNFEIHFRDAEGNLLRDDYAYDRYTYDHQFIERDLIIYEGGTFTLKNGEYIIIPYLPVGTQYTVKELYAPGYITGVTIDRQKPVQSDTMTDTIQKVTQDWVTFINTTGTELPQTGGTGKTLTMPVGLAIIAGAVMVLILVNKPPRKRGRREAGG